MATVGVKGLTLYSGNSISLLWLSRVNPRSCVWADYRYVSDQWSRHWLNTKPC